MLKKFVLFTFVGVISSASVLVSASNNYPDKTNVATTVVSEQVDKQDGQVNNFAVNSHSGKASLTKIESESTLPATKWILFLTLIGFVALSNRRGF